VSATYSATGIDNVGAASSLEQDPVQYVVFVVVGGGGGTVMIVTWGASVLVVVGGAGDQVAGLGHPLHALAVDDARRPNPGGTQGLSRPPSPYVRAMWVWHRQDRIHVEPNRLNRHNDHATKSGSGHPTWAGARIPWPAVNEALIAWLMTPEAPALPVTLEELLHRPEWHQRAACRGVGGVDQYVLGRGSYYSRDLCEVWLVRQECLETALADIEFVGLWGGTTPVERKKMRRARVA
jgi:hypothetical protein